MQVTKTQVAEILDSKAAELVQNVEALLLAVKSTNDFEAEMSRRFGGTQSEDSEHEVNAQILTLAFCTSLHQCYVWVACMLAYGVVTCGTQ